MEKRKVRLISFILCVFLLAGTFVFISPVNLRAEAVDISAESSSVIIMESVGNDNLAVTNSSFIRFSDSEVYYNMPLGYEAIFAKLYGNTLYVLGNNGSLSVNLYNIDSAGLIGSYSIGISPYSIKYLTIDSGGNVYIVEYNSPTVISRYQNGSLVYSYDTGSEIDLIDSTGGSLYIVMGSTLLYGGAGGDVGGFDTYNLKYSPALFLNDYSYISSNGYYVVLSGDEYLMYAGGVIPNKACTFLNDKQHFYAYNGKVYAHFTFNAVSIGTTWLDDFYSYYIDGNFMAVNSNGIILKDNGRLVFYTHKPYAPEEPEIESSSSESNTQAPDIFDGCVFIENSITVSEFYKTHGVKVFTENGSEASGNIKTGMFVTIDSADYPIALKGDVNGTGTVNSSDMSALQQHLIGKSLLSGANKTSADLNRDGVLDTYDLYLLSKLIS